jgi:hypothetical protein
MCDNEKTGIYPKKQKLKPNETEKIKTLSAKSERKYYFTLGIAASVTIKKTR